ncbi:peptidoglycan DD-metalloendopeptidase family protein [Streptomyces iakyrus]|uniref:peptidoglycan DD-metalloendopeptidase family protein n=1 Tax=Streptomyces iakyrus TaxID=68219 RepID=UPI00339FEECA
MADAPVLLPEVKEEPVTDEQYPFQGTIPATHALNTWQGGGAEYSSPGLHRDGIADQPYAQADWWGTAHGDEPLYGAAPGVWGHGTAPVPGAHDAGHLPYAVGGYEEQAACHGGVLGIPGPDTPDAFGHTEVGDRWGAAHPAETWWSETAVLPDGGHDPWSAPTVPPDGGHDPWSAPTVPPDGGHDPWSAPTSAPDGGHDTWSAPTGASASGWEAVPYAEPDWFPDALAHPYSDSPPAHEPPFPSPESHAPLPADSTDRHTVDTSRPESTDNRTADVSRPESSRHAREGTVAAVPAPRRSDLRGRRASPRRSAFLSVTAPSVAFLGISGFAAASVGLGDPSGETVRTEADTSPLAASPGGGSALDTQLAQLPDDARDFADRASRAQERLDLEQKRLEEQKRRREEAARKKAEAARREALRPKFALPVAQRGVGELFGAVGSMWSNRHTGLDFPVPMNTPVMAVTDGTVQTKWDRFYGNMVIVTAPDGTQTWYCHLASARISSGYVKAGQVIAYAGSSGNSSGPHLHLEVRPGGGDPIDPLAWLRSHGLDPT